MHRLSLPALEQTSKFAGRAIVLARLCVLLALLGVCCSRIALRLSSRRILAPQVEPCATSHPCARAWHCVLKLAASANVGAWSEAVRPLARGAVVLHAAATGIAATAHVGHQTLPGTTCIDPPPASAPTLEQLVAPTFKQLVRLLAP